MNALHREHECRPENMRLGRWLTEVLGESRPIAWLAPKNDHLHKCQRCGYIVWRDA